METSIVSLPVSYYAAIPDRIGEVIGARQASLPVTMQGAYVEGSRDGCGGVSLVRGEPAECESATVAGNASTFLRAKRVSNSFLQTSSFPQIAW